MDCYGAGGLQGPGKRRRPGGLTASAPHGPRGHPREVLAPFFKLRANKARPGGTLGKIAWLSPHRGRLASRIKEAGVMAEDKGDRGAEDKIKKGMEESGRDQV